MYPSPDLDLEKPSKISLEKALRTEKWRYAQNEKVPILLKKTLFFA